MLLANRPICSPEVRAAARQGSTLVREGIQIVRLAAVASLVGAIGCGGGSSSGSGAGAVTPSPTRRAPSPTRTSDTPATPATPGASPSRTTTSPAQTPTRAPTAVRTGGGFGMTLPPAVNVVRIIFESAELRCCVAIFPDETPIDPSTGRREVVLQPLPPGPATVVLSGFPGALAPAPAGVSSVCPTVPISVGRACVPGANDTPSFTSDPTDLIVEPGGIADVGQVPVQSVPFVLDASRQPAPGSTAASPVSLAFVVADATQGVNPDSVRLQLTDADGLSSDVPLELTPCNDRGSVVCSVDGALEVRGVRAAAAARALPVGLTRVRVTASNLGDPPRTVATEWRFQAGPTVAIPTATATRSFTPTPTSSPSRTASASVTPSRTTTATVAATASATATLPPTITATRTERPIPSATLTATASRTATTTRTASASPTATLSATATPTRTITRSPTVAPTVAPCTLQSPENLCVPGSSSSRNGCDLEWLFMPAPELPASGIPRRSISCREGDATCDLDGKSDARCTFRLSLCINNDDPRVPSCIPSQLDSFEVRQPNPQRPLDAADSANLAGLEAAAGPAGFGVTVRRGDLVVSRGVPNATRNLCSAPLSIVVPLGGSTTRTTGVRRLRLRVSEKQMVMRLSCLPPS